MIMRRPEPKASTPYEAAMWASFGVFWLALAGVVVSVFLWRDFNTFAALMLLAFGSGVATMMAKDMHYDNRLRESQGGRSVDPREDLFNQSGG